MSRPQIIVNVAAALSRRGAPTDTGPAFMAFIGATGPAAPVQCLSRADAITAAAPTAIADYVADALDIGAPSVWIVKAAGADADAALEAAWTAALSLFTGELGPGQVLIPGVATAAAHSALLAHAAATKRCALLDGASNAAGGATATAATALVAASGSTSTGWVGPWVTVPAGGGTTRTVPGSVIAAGLAARGDAFHGHANNAPAGDQGRGAGVIERGTAVTMTYTAAELDSLHEAGVSVIRMVNGSPTLMGWRSLADPAGSFRQLNVGRMVMQLGVGINASVGKFLFQQIDGRGHRFAELEGALRGYLQPLWLADALYGDEADDAFDVDVSGVNTPTTVAAGELHAAVAVNLTPHTEKVVIDVVTTVAA